MDFLKAQIARIQQQLNGLSASQKMLAGALVIIMMMTLYGWSLFAGRAEMEPLLTQSLTDDETLEIRKHLVSNGIRHQLNGGRIEVAADQKYDAMAILGYAQALPRDTSSAFDNFIKNSSIFDPKSKTDALLNQARQQELTRVLRAFPPVRQATVLIDPTREQGFKKSEPSATVSLFLRSGQHGGQRLADAAADLVSGAVANMPRERVHVIIDGKAFRVKGLEDDSAISSGEDWMSLVERNEQRLRNNLRDFLSYIDGVQIIASVRPNLERIEKNVHTPDGKNVLVKPVTEETTTEERTGMQGGGGDPGVGANLPMSVADASAGGKDSNTTEKSKSENAVDYARTDTKSSNPGGDATVTGVSVLIPRSYFVQVYRKQPGNSSKEPDDAALRPLIDEGVNRVKNSVKTYLALANDSMIDVNWFPDVGPLVSAESQATAATSIPLAVGDHVKEIALGALALVSLFMVSSMVRKGASPTPVVESAPPPKPALLRAPEEAVGEAGEGGAMLDGMELDEDSVKAQQMLSQVQNMVGENPDAAAAMVKRWLNH